MHLETLSQAAVADELRATVTKMKQDATDLADTLAELRKKSQHQDEKQKHDIEKVRTSRNTSGDFSPL